MQGQTKFFIKKITFSKKLNGKRIKKKWLNFGGKRRKNTAKNRLTAKILNQTYSDFVKLKNTTFKLQKLRKTEYGIQNLGSADETKFQAELNFTDYVKSTIKDFTNKNIFNNKKLNIFSNQLKDELNFFKDTKKILKNKFFKNKMEVNYNNEKYELKSSAVRNLFELYKSDLYLKKRGISANLSAIDEWDYEGDEAPNLPFNTPTGDNLEWSDGEERNKYIEEKHKVLNEINKKINAMKNGDLNILIDDFKIFIQRRAKYLVQQNLANLEIIKK